MNWLLLVAIAVGTTVASAQEPSASNDDVNATFRIIIDPNADTPDDIVRKIAAAKPKRSGKATDAPAKDLASPGKEGPDEGGTPENPDTTTDPDLPAGPGTPEPTTPPPVGPAPHDGGSGGGHGPDVGAPNPRGHDVPPAPKPHDKSHGKPNDKPPHNPRSHPPATPPPPRGPRPPGHQPPGHQPPGPKPPKPG